MIRAEKKYLEIIKSIVLTHIPQVIIKAYGSRVNGTSKPHSDLDLVLISQEKITSIMLAKIEEDLESSHVPFRVDICDWDRISQEFKDIILQKNEDLT